MATPLMADTDGIDVTDLAHLANPNWGDLRDRRCIAAALVEAVYLLQSNQGKAKQWCALLPFELKEEEIMRDNCDNKIFGATFKWIGVRKESGSYVVGPPSEVVAIRGTILRPNTMLRDIEDDWNVAFARMDELSRVDVALKYLRASIERHGPQNIWIVGHSLGVSIALSIARKLGSQERDKMEAYLFNPPFIFPTLHQLKLFEMVGITLSKINNGPLSIPFPQLEEIYKGIQGFSEAIALRLGLKDEKILLELYIDFIGVGNWIPNLYVNGMDPICCTYIKYLKAWKDIYSHKSHLVFETMKHLFCFEVAKNRTPWHMVLSAKLFVVNTHFFPNSHGLNQWWSRDLKIQSILKYVPPIEVTQWKDNKDENYEIH